MDIRSYMQYHPDIAQIFSELPDELLNLVRIRSYRANEVIVQHCEKNCDMFVILSGVLCSTCNFINGERKWFRKATAGDVFGVLGIFDKYYGYEFSATIFAKTSALLAIIPSDVARQCFNKCPSFATEMTRRIVERLNFELWRMEECNAYPPYMGVITYLIYAYEFYARSAPPDYTGPVWIKEKQDEIAHYVGITVRTLQRVLPVIRDEALIDYRSGRIYVDRLCYEKLKKRKMEYFR